MLKQLQWLSFLFMIVMSFAHAEERPPLPQGFNFDTAYLHKYFPKVFVTCDFFLRMTVPEVEKALGSIVDMLGVEPSDYFVNKGEQFNPSHYWEHVIDQLSWMSDFLESARVDVASGRVLDRLNYDDYFSYVYMHNNAEKEVLLCTLLSENKQGAYYQFYALCFDYLKKMFNEGILLPDLYQAMTTLSELQFVTEKLRSSIYEAEYQEHLKQANELLVMLKQKQGVDSEALEADSMRSKMRNRMRRRV